MKAISLLISLLFAGLSHSQPDTSNMVISEARYIPMERTVLYKLGELTVPLHISQYGDASTNICVNLHDNEGTSVQAARQVLETKGGILIRIENGEQRQIKFRLRGRSFTIDPNRIFSRAGIRDCLVENRCYADFAVDIIENFGKRILDLIPGKASCIIALHNNTEGNYSIRSYLPGGDKRKDAREVFAAPGQDMDDIAFTTDETLYRKMAAFGYNSIWQDNRAVKKDGSLSVYCGENDLRYINIETEHGKTSQYEEMLSQLLDLLGSSK
jgi:hypothetical protein